MKKRLLAVLLIVAMVFATLAVIAACEPEGSTEYTVTFRRMGIKVFDLETVNGKLSQADVEAKTQENIARIDNRQDDGYFFSGWYETVDTVDGAYVYSDPIDYNASYIADADYEAGWDFLPSEGLEQGYTLIGVIGGVTNWTPGTEAEAWKLVQDETEGWIYRVTVDVIGGDQIKVKEKSNAWLDDVCNLGWDGLGDVLVKEGTTLELKDHALKGADIESLVWGSDKSNVYISAYIEEANITVEYNYRTNKFSITFNSITVLDEIPEFHYILVGNLAEANWDAKSTLEALTFAETEDANVFTLDYTFRRGDAWQVTWSDGSWSWQIGGSNLGDVTAATDVDITYEGNDEPTIDEILAVLFSGEGDISTKYACEVTITIDVEENTIDILVKSVTIPASTWEQAGYVIAGSLGGESKWDTDTTDTARKFTRVDDTDIGKLEYTFAADDQFKVATNVADWGGAINIGWDRNMVVVDEEDNAVENLFESKGGNIGVRAGCTVVITLDTAEGKISILVKEHDTIPPVVADTHDWGLIGGFDGWSTDVATLTNNAETSHKTGTYTFTEEVEFKLRILGDWGTSVGWHDENVQIVAQGDLDIDGLFVNSQGNIKVTAACTVSFDLYYVNGDNWVLIITVTALGD